MEFIKDEILGENPPPSDDTVSPFIEPYSQETRHLAKCIRCAAQAGALHRVLVIFHCRALWEVCATPETAVQDNQIVNLLASHRHDYAQALQTLFPPETLAPLLPHPSWARIYEPDLVLNADVRQSFLDQADHGAASAALLENYCSWWLLGKGLAKNDSYMLLRETGRFDPIDSIQPEERFRFQTLIPALHFALCTIVADRDAHHLLERIALNQPNDTPDFPGEDLWLQRKALELLTRLYGVDYFMDTLVPEITPSHILHMFLKNKTIQHNKELLIATIQTFAAFSDFEGTDYYDHLSDLIQLLSRFPSQQIS